MHPYRTAAPILEPPPRRVPHGVAARLRLGGVLGTVGWAVACFGSLLAWIFAGSSELATLGWFAAGVEEVPGEVVSVDSTNMKENDARVLAVRARFSHGGEERHVTSYTLGSWPHVGAAVVVEVEKGAPEHARIQGMRTRPFGAFVAFVFVFPVIGLGLAIAQWVRGGRRVALLGRGRVAAGRFLEKHATGARVNKRRVYRVVFEFEDEGGRKHRTEARTHTPEVLEDDAAEQLLYDPRDPSKATLVDHLPGRPRVDAQGRIHDAGAVLTAGAYALPALAVGINVVAMLLV